jgi:multidrug transporter EmrE-like cation transporter
VLPFQYQGWNKWQLLAAMQALLVYLIFKVDEGHPEYNSFDSLLVALVVVSQAFLSFLAKHLADSIGTGYAIWYCYRDTWR